MTASWETTLTAIGCRLNAAEAHACENFDFGDPIAELRAAAETTVASPLPQLTAILVNGADAASFLHNQLTNDVNHLAVGSVQHAAWCTAKGRIIATMLVARRPSDYLLLLASDVADKVTKRLSMYVLRSKVRVERSDLAVVGIHGAKALEDVAALASDVQLGDFQMTSDKDFIRIRTCGPATLLLASQEWIRNHWTLLIDKAVPVGSNAWNWIEIQAGIPRVGAETSEEFVPQMIGFEEIGGISFHKGCYPGQEIVARTQYLGKVKRHLYRACGSAGFSAGQAIFSSAQPDNACGAVAMSASGPSGIREALVVVQENFTDGPLHVGSLDGPLLQLQSPVVHC